MDSESEGTNVRAVMENLPTLAKSPAQASGRPQKGKVSRSYNTLVYDIHSQGDPVQSTRPNVTQKGCTERSNPPKALPGMGVGDQAISPGGKDGSTSKDLIVMVRIC